MMAPVNRMILSEIGVALFVFSLIVFSYRPGLTMISQAVSCLLIAAFLYEAVYKNRNFRLMMPLPFFCFFCYVMYAALSQIWTQQSFSFIVTLLQLLLVSFIIINIIHYMGHIRPLYYSMTAALLATSLNLWNELGSGVFHAVASDRASSYLGNANTYAFALSIGMIFAIDTLYRKPELPRRGTINVLVKIGLILLLLLFSYEIIFLTGSRKGMISVFIVAFMYFLRQILKAKFTNKILTVVLGSVFFVFLGIVIQQSVFFERFSRLLDMVSGQEVREFSLDERADMIAVGMQLWKEKPLTGWGTDQFRNLSGFHTYSHNNFIELLSNSGMIGLVLYYSMILLLLLAGSKMLFAKDRMINHYGWFCVTSLFVIILWDFGIVSYYGKLNWLWLSVIIGITGYANSAIKMNRQAATVIPIGKEQLA